MPVVGDRVAVELGVVHDGAELTVTDTGIGIGASDRHRVFSRFFRSRHAAEQSIQGVGLGLSITKAIVESHGGRIWAEPNPGGGVVFHFTTPAATAEEEADAH